MKSILVIQMAFKNKPEKLNWSDTFNYFYDGSALDQATKTLDMLNNRDSDYYKYRLVKRYMVEEILKSPD